MKKYLPVLLALVMLGGCKQDMSHKELGNAAAAKKILIAGDTSEFKEKVFKRVIEKIGSDNYAITVIGLDNLKKEDTDKYSVIVLGNTLWANKIDSRVEEFLKADPTNKKVIVFTSVGGELNKPKLQVDAITSASQDDRIESRSTELANLIKKKLF
jgi:flavorubredoxin